MIIFWRKKLKSEKKSVWVPPKKNKTQNTLALPLVTIDSYHSLYILFAYIYFVILKIVNMYNAIQC